MSESRAEPSAVLFHAVLVPQRSADLRSERVAVFLVTTVLGVAAFGFFTIGAWPVSGFCGLQVGLFYGAMRMHDWTTRTAETVSLTPDRLHVRRMVPDGSVQEWAFMPYWLRVELTEEKPPASGSLLLTSHGHSVALGTFLSEDERQAVARRLIEALAPLSGLTTIAAQAAALQV